MQKTKIMVVAGARPNFMKIGPLMKELRQYPDQFESVLLHTGQHYDYQMSEVFFQELGIPKPDIFLGVKAGSHAVQTAEIMVEFEKVALEHKPDLLVVVGDVTSTIACTLVASKLGIKVAHVEAGLRSFDRSMPEEINRLVTDALSDFLFVSEESGLENLKKEGVPDKKVFYAGNIMIDTLVANLPKVDKSGIIEKHVLKKGGYAVATVHRPSNVDSKEALAEIVDIFSMITQKMPLVYPIHPRTRKNLENFGLMDKFGHMRNLVLTEPLGYIDFVKLVKESKFVLTDSGGIQEETTVLRVPCITMRENTERPSTIEEGTNELVGRSRRKIEILVNKIVKNQWKKGKIPKHWDGKTAQRIVQVLKKHFPAQRKSSEEPVPAKA